MRTLPVVVRLPFVLLTDRKSIASRVSTDPVLYTALRSLSMNQIHAFKCEPDNALSESYLDDMLSQIEIKLPPPFLSFFLHLLSRDVGRVRVKGSGGGGRSM